MSFTFAPASLAALATSIPIRPDDLLPIKRTSSIDSRVPPAVTITVFPERVFPKQKSTICSTSGILPTPESSPVSRPDAGSITRIPRLERVSTLLLVARFNHISECIAGTSTTGALLAKIAFVSRSSARPVASRERKDAVAGATTIRSACCPSSTCLT